MRSLHRRLTACVVAGVTVLALAGPAAAIDDDPYDPPTPPSPPPTTPAPPPSNCPSPGTTTPQYRIKLVRFRATDESHADWLGSDEPYFVFSSTGTTGTSTTRKSATYSGIDTGDTRSFGVWDYVWGNSCNGLAAPLGIGYSLQLWESDGGVSESTRTKTAQYFTYAGTISSFISSAYPELAWLPGAVAKVGQATNTVLGWLKDDLLGTATATFSRSELASRLSSVGSSFTKTVYLGGAATSDGADYYVDMSVTRTR
jgi:hypothetical protein